MQTAATINTTPTLHPAMRIGGADFAAGLARPRRTEAETPLSSLNRRFRELASKHHEMDQLELTLPAGPSRDAVEEKKDTMLGQILSLQDEAVKLPARTIQDAAIQALFAYYRIDGLTVDENDEPDSRAAMSFLASIVLSLGKIGAFDIDDIGWGHTRGLRAFRALAGSAEA